MTPHISDLKPNFSYSTESASDQNAHSGYYYIESSEGIWNSGREENPNLGYKPRHKEGYFPVPPTDSQVNLRTEMVMEMLKCGIYVEREHHEVATAGQAEIDMRFDSLVKMADKNMLFKYIIKNVARRHGKTVTFMPKPLSGDNGSGMHCHQSIWKGGKPLFAGDGFAVSLDKPLDLGVAGEIGLRCLPATGCGLQLNTTQNDND